MKKIFTVLFLLSICLITFSQTPFKSGIDVKGTANLHDTTKVNKLKFSDGSVQTTAGGGGSPSWGSITGTLSSQSDLNTALTGKQNNLTLTTTGSSGASTLIGSTLNIPQYSGGGSTSLDSTKVPLLSDFNTLPEINIVSPAKGLTATNSVTNYSYASIDSVRAKFSTTIIRGNEYGGWLTSNLTGDSVKVNAPFWLIIGDSQAEGMPGLRGRLSPYVGVFSYNYPDSFGQLSYHLRQLTNMKFYNQGIGSETSTSTRYRFYRDALGISSYVSDTRPNMTIGSKPQGIIIVTGINDIFQGLPVATTKANLEWFASTCKEFGIQCVILNIPGDAASSQAIIRNVSNINFWLKSGVLDQYNACVVDYNKWWNDPAYGNDNYHHRAEIIDDIHPTKTGYNLLASYIFQQAKLPVLKKVIFYSELSPEGFSGYSRPTSITISANPYTISKSIDTLTLNTNIPDSLYIKINATTNITGTSYTGFNHIEWIQTNNVSGNKIFTKKSLFNGSKSNIDASSITINNSNPLPPSSYRDLFTINNSTINTIFKVSGGSSDLSSSFVFGTPSWQSTVSMNGTLTTTGKITSSYGQIGQYTIGNAGHPFQGGINQFNNAMVFDYYDIPSQDQFIFSAYNSTASPVFGGVTGTTYGAVRIKQGWGNMNNTNIAGYSLYVTPTFNNAVNTYQSTLGGICFEPTVTALGGSKLIGFKNTVGENLFNTVSGSTGINVTTVNPASIVEIASVKKGFLFPRMTTGQRDSIGFGVGSVTVVSGGSGFNYTPVVTFSGSNGVSATGLATVSGDAVASIIITNRGAGYSGTPTISLSGVGVGASLTVNMTNIVPEGLMIYNLTTHKLEYYNGTIWISL